MILIALLLSLNLVSANHVEWALENGGYLHKNIEYRDNGMYATGNIQKGELMASIPKTLEYKCDNCSHAEYIEMMEKEVAKPDSFWAPYIDSLPDTCQNNLCQTANSSLLTVRGMIIHNNSKMEDEESVIASRKWNTGMRPLLELFNHHHGAYPVLMNDSHYTLNASVNYTKGDQVFDKYNNNGVFNKFMVYGFFENKPLTCEDMITMRRGEDVQRVACIAYSNSTTALMLEEIKEAQKHGDLAMIKGASQWLDRNIVYNLK